MELYLGRHGHRHSHTYTAQVTGTWARGGLLAEGATMLSRVEEGGGEAVYDTQIQH